MRLCRATPQTDPLTGRQIASLFRSRARPFFDPRAAPHGSKAQEITSANRIDVALSDAYSVSNAKRTPRRHRCMIVG
jgi:hypothetical protein